MARSRFFPGWYVVIGSGIGIGSGSVPFFASSFALLAAAMAKQFGWQQAEVATAASIYLLMQTVAYPLCGWPLDRFGSRKFAGVSIVLFSICLVVLSQIGSLWQLYAAFALMGLVAAGTNVVSYARAITLWFNRRRGLAMGLAASAQAVGAFGMPIAMQHLIGAHGWPVALIVFAVFELIVALPLVALLVKDSPAAYGLAADGVPATPAAEIAAAPAEHDMTVGEVIRTGTFWKLAISFAIMGMSFYAIAPNIAYILTKKAGMTLGDVAVVQAVAGIATLFGRIGFGHLLDRFHAPLIAVAALALTASCAAIYSVTAVSGLIIFATVLNGLAIGGDTDLMPYLASRYFGVRAVSRIFGWFLFAFFLGAAVGPVAFAKLSALYGSADTPLMVLAALQIVPAALFLSLGRYEGAAGLAGGRRLETT